MTMSPGRLGCFLGTCVAMGGIWGAETYAFGVPPSYMGPKETPLQLLPGPGEVNSLPGYVPRARTVGAEVESVQATAVGGDNCNEATISPVAVPGSLTIFGDSTPATGPDLCLTATLTLWWEAFEITRCADVTLDFCGTNPQLPPPLFVAVASECSADGSVCTPFINADSGGLDCPDGNLTMIFEALPPASTTTRSSPTRRRPTK